MKFLTIILAFVIFLFESCIFQEALYFHKIANTEVLATFGFIEEFQDPSKAKCLNRCRLSKSCIFALLRDNKCRLYDSTAAKYPSYSNRASLFVKPNTQCPLGVCPNKRNLNINLTYHFNTGAVRQLIYLNNGYMASASSNIALWDIFDFSYKSILVKYNTMSGLATSPNNDLMSIISNGTILIWNTNDNTVKKSISPPASISQYALKALPNGCLAIGTNRNNSVVVIDPEDGSIKMELFGHGNVITDFAVLKNNLLASSSMDCDIIIWNLTSKSPIEVLSNHSLNAYKLAVLPNGDLVSAGWDGLLIIWNSLDWPIKLKIKN